METRDSSGIDRRRRLDRRRRDYPGFAGPDRRMKGVRRGANLQRVADAVGEAAVVHRLLPAKGHRFLSPLRVVARIESEFAYVEADDAEGCRKAESMIENLKKLRGRRHESDSGQISRLEKVKGDAIHLRFGDDPTSETEYISLTVIPGEPLIVECESSEHAQAAELLLKRCAKALGYSIIRQRTAAQ